MSNLEDRDRRLTENLWKPSEAPELSRWIKENVNTAIRDLCTSSVIASSFEQVRKGAGFAVICYSDAFDLPIQQTTISDVITEFADCYSSLDGIINACDVETVDSPLRDIEAVIAEIRGRYRSDKGVAPI